MLLGYRIESQHAQLQSEGALGLVWHPFTDEIYSERKLPKTTLQMLQTEWVEDFCSSSSYLVSGLIRQLAECMHERSTRVEFRVAT